MKGMDNLPCSREGQYQK
uniref:Uncharacterized protein n=1 Tax=Rhizophora mucronata TaxID=61149 RepID=A0A2P2QBB7_RHIMU